MSTNTRDWFTTKSEQELSEKSLLGSSYFVVDNAQMSTQSAADFESNDDD